MPSYAYGELTRDKRGRIQVPHGLQTHDPGMLRTQPVRRMVDPTPQVSRLFALGFNLQDPYQTTARRIGINQQLPPHMTPQMGPRPVISVPIGQPSTSIIRQSTPTKFAVYAQGDHHPRTHYIPVGGRMLRVLRCV
jgi:hypothetical protein